MIHGLSSIHPSSIYLPGPSVLVPHDDGGGLEQQGVVHRHDTREFVLDPTVVQERDRRGLGRRFIPPRSELHDPPQAL